MKTLGNADEVGRYNNFNLIRLFAAIVVIFGHAWPITGAGMDPISSALAVPKHYIGAAAVEIFFLTSGFLLSASAYRDNEPFSFMANRARRIYPALIVCNVVVILFCYLRFNFGNLAFFTQKQTVGFFIRNSIMLFYSSNDQFSRWDWLPNSFSTVKIGSVNGSLWTLIAELKAYAYMSVILILGVALLRERFRDLQKWTWLGMLAVSEFGFHYLPLIGGDPGFRPMFVFYFLGACLYSWRQFIPLNRYFLAVAMLALIIAAARAPSLYLYVAHLAYPYIVLYAAYGAPYVTLQDKFGDYSYGTYIYGWFCETVVFDVLRTGPWLVFLYSTLVAVGLGALSWYLVERPILSTKPRRSRIPDAEPEARRLSA